MLSLAKDSEGFAAESRSERALQAAYDENKHLSKQVAESKRTLARLRERKQKYDPMHRRKMEERLDAAQDQIEDLTNQLKEHELTLETVMEDLEEIREGEDEEAAERAQEETGEVIREIANLEHDISGFLSEIGEKEERLRKLRLRMRQAEQGLLDQSSAGLDALGAPPAVPPPPTDGGGELTMGDLFGGLKRAAASQDSADGTPSDAGGVARKSTVSFAQNSEDGGGAAPGLAGAAPRLSTGGAAAASLFVRSMSRALSFIGDASTVIPAGPDRSLPNRTGSKRGLIRGGESGFGFGSQRHADYEAPTVFTDRAEAEFEIDMLSAELAGRKRDQKRWAKLRDAKTKRLGDIEVVTENLNKRLAEKMTELAPLQKAKKASDETKEKVSAKQKFKSRVSGLISSNRMAKRMGLGKKGDGEGKEESDFMERQIMVLEIEGGKLASRLQEIRTISQLHEKIQQENLRHKDLETKFLDKVLTSTSALSDKLDFVAEFLDKEMDRIAGADQGQSIWRAEDVKTQTEIRKKHKEIATLRTKIERWERQQLRGMKRTRQVEKDIVDKRTLLQRLKLEEQ